MSDEPLVDILHYAAVLENLEATFYAQGLANFSETAFAAAGFDSTVYQNIQSIAAHEGAHVQFLNSALQTLAQPISQACTYNFGISTVEQFMATAAIFEGIGTSAYLGAAAQVANKAVLTAAGSILTVEARHNAYLRSVLSESPFPQSQDTPLTPDEVYTLAHGFIVSCPSSNPTFPVKVFPGLVVPPNGTVASGNTITLQTGGYVLAPNNPSIRLYAAFVTAHGTAYADVIPTQTGMTFSVTVPDGVNGQSYLLLTNSNTGVSDDTVIAGPALVEVSSSGCAARRSTDHC